MTKAYLFWSFLFAFANNKLQIPSNRCIIAKKIQIDLADMDYKSWYDALKKDAETLQLLISMLEEVYRPRYTIQHTKFVYLSVDIVRAGE